MRAESSPPSPPTPFASTPSLSPLTFSLGIGQEGVLLHLEHPTPLGPCDLRELTIHLGAATFPLDASSGVASLRTRTGSLTRFTATLDPQRLASWLTPSLQGLLDTPIAVSVQCTHERLLCVLHPTDSWDDTVPLQLLAFDAYLLCHGEDLHVTLAHARGTGLRAPATALACRALEAGLGRWGTRRGASVVLHKALARLVHHATAQAGVPPPHTHSTGWTSLACEGNVILLQASRDQPPPTPTLAALHAQESNTLTAAGDEARLHGLWEEARQQDQIALEEAPHHADILLRLAELDALAQRPAEALRHLAPGGPRPEDLRLYATLLATVGRKDEAYTAWLDAAAQEESDLLAGESLASAAACLTDPAQAARLLTQALKRAPAVGAWRWARIDRWLTLGQVDQASAEIAHLVDQVPAEARCTVLLRGAHCMQHHGYPHLVPPLLEQAQGYAADTPAQLQALGQAFAQGGHPAQGLLFLRRALDHALKEGLRTGGTLLAMARVLAEPLEDYPTAIARLRQIAWEEPEATLAQGLEGRWRVLVGDLSGASLAFARMEERLLEEEPSSAPLEEVLPLLEEAATLAQESFGALNTAQRYRRLAAQYTDTLHREPIAQATDLPPDRTHQAPMSFAAYLQDTEEGELTTDTEANARVEQLTQTLRADPTQSAVIQELAALLAQLGRSYELLALLSARLEETPPETKPSVQAEIRPLLIQLADEARAHNRLEEAALFDQLRASFSHNF